VRPFAELLRPEHAIIDVAVVMRLAPIIARLLLYRAVVTVLGRFVRQRVLHSNRVPTRRRNYSGFRLLSGAGDLETQFDVSHGREADMAGDVLHGAIEQETIRLDLGEMRLEKRRHIDRR
jgi:hypothetical protein